MHRTQSYIDAYHERGFAVARAVFSRRDIAELVRAFDRMRAEGARHQRSFRHGNVFYLVRPDPRLGPTLRLMQWPSYVDPVLARYRNDPRLLPLLEPLIGPDLKQITNTILWKPPGSLESGFAYHQDCRFRRPQSAFRNVETAMVQTAIAIDPHRLASGCMRMCAGSHRHGDLHLGVTSSVYESSCDDGELQRAGLDPGDVVDLILEPGDVVLWHPHIVHGSSANTSHGDRRSYLNAYVNASDSDRGAWAFRGGVPCDLGEPALIQYEDLFVRPEPHYVDGPPHPFKPG